MCGVNKRYLLFLIILVKKRLTLISYNKPGKQRLILQEMQKEFLQSESNDIRY